MLLGGAQAAGNNSPGNVIEAEKWMHVAASYDGDARIYVNGEEVVEIKKGQKLTPSEQPLRIGHRNGSSHYYNGLMDEVAVFSRALKLDELKLVMEGLEALLAVKPGGKLTTTWGRIKNLSNMRR